MSIKGTPIGMRPTTKKCHEFFLINHCVYLTHLFICFISGITCACMCLCIYMLSRIHSQPVYLNTIMKARKHLSCSKLKAWRDTHKKWANGKKRKRRRKISKKEWSHIHTLTIKLFFFSSFILAVQHFHIRKFSE